MQPLKIVLTTLSMLSLSLLVSCGDSGITEAPVGSPPGNLPVDNPPTDDPASPY